MNKQFGELVQQYQQAIKITDVQKLDTILSEMRKNIQERINNINNSIMEASYEDLLKINGEINAIETSDAMTSISENTRQANQKRNKYGPDNPYPPQDNTNTKNGDISKNNKGCA